VMPALYLTFARRTSYKRAHRLDRLDAFDYRPIRLILSRLSWKLRSKLKQENC